MPTLKIKTIVFNDDAEIHCDEDSKILYTPNDPFVVIWYKGIIRELINIQGIRSMDVLPPESTSQELTEKAMTYASHPPSRRCKWCQQLTKSTPCSNCGK